jgi:protein translocase SecG subunit
MPFFLIAQIVIAILIAGAVLLQPGESGFSTAGSFMSGGEHFHTRRGLEKFLFYATFVLLALFAVLSLAAMR